MRWLKVISLAFLALVVVLVIAANNHEKAQITEVEKYLSETTKARFQFAAGSTSKRVRRIGQTADSLYLFEIIKSADELTLTAMIGVNNDTVLQAPFILTKACSITSGSEFDFNEVTGAMAAALKNHETTLTHQNTTAVFNMTMPGPPIISVVITKKTGV